MNVRNTDWRCLGLVVLAFAVAAWLYPELPDPVPTHWSLAGEPDGFTPKPWGAFVLPLATLGTYVLLRVLPVLSPKAFRNEGFLEPYDFLLCVIVAFVAGLSVLTLLAASGAPISLPRAVSVALGLLFIVLGNYMGKLRRNFFIGIRTPWTLADDEVWARTHRFGGKLFVAAGFLLVAAGVLAWPPLAFIVIVLVTAVVAVAYSFFIHVRIA